MPPLKLLLRNSTVISVALCQGIHCKNWDLFLTDCVNIVLKFKQRIISCEIEYSSDVPFLGPNFLYYWRQFCYLTNNIFYFSIYNGNGWLCWLTVDHVVLLLSLGFLLFLIQPYKELRWVHGVPPCQDQHVY